MTTGFLWYALVNAELLHGHGKINPIRLHLQSQLPLSHLFRPCSNLFSASVHAVLSGDLFGTVQLCVSMPYTF